MKRMMQTMLLTVIMVFMVGCSASTEEQTTGNASNTQSDKVEKEDKDTVTLERPQAADYIQSAIDYANMIAGEGLVMSEEGEFYALRGDTDDLVALYSSFGKEIKQLRRWGSNNYLLLTEDGDVYYNSRLIVSGKNVVDILWKTNNVGVNAILLLENGNYIRFSSESGVSDSEREANAIVAARWREDLITLGADGNYECGGRWAKCEIKDWKNTVVLEVTANEEKDTATIAGIAADGTVYATGDYAEDILSWGELAYISMDDRLIVGLKKDGTLAFTGELGEAYSKLDTVDNVKGVRLWRDYIWIVKDDGVYYDDYEHMSDTSSPEIEKVDFALKMDKEGNIYINTYSSENDSWKLSEYPKANVENADGLIWYQLLLNSNKIADFFVQDLNGDGAVEIIANTMDGGQAVYVNHGYLEKVIEGLWLEGYYPKSGIIVVMSDSSFVSSEMKYYSFSDGKQSVVLSKKYTSEPDSVYYYKGNIGSKEISEAEFNEMLESYIGTEEMSKISNDDFLQNTEENLRKTFGIE